MCARSGAMHYLYAGKRLRCKHMITSIYEVVKQPDFYIADFIYASVIFSAYF